MSPAMVISNEKGEEYDTTQEGNNHQYLKGVKQLLESGIQTVPKNFILPASERPTITSTKAQDPYFATNHNFKLPIIDFSQLIGPNRAQLLQSLASACENLGIFQVVNHGIEEGVMNGMRDVIGRFFNMKYEERCHYMTNDMRAAVRYGTSFSQSHDSVLCWRDFLKLLCHPLPQYLPLWPSSPPHFREVAATYAEETRHLFMRLMEAILESLGIKNEGNDDDGDNILKDLENGSQMMVANMFPTCPEPELTLGMPPHSDYGFLTLLLQDDVDGLQIQSQGNWVTIQPIPNSFVVNVGDHLEIYSNGRYKSVLHRVLVNANRNRTSVASLHSLPFNHTVRPSPKLIDEANPRRYEDTDFDTFLAYVTTREPKGKDFLDSRKLSTSKYYDSLLEG